MPPVKLMDNENATMWCYPEKKIIRHQYHKFMSGKIFQEFLMTGTEAMRKYGATKWLSDDRNNPILSPTDLKWGQTIWFPATLAAGWKYWAIVQPKAILAKMTMEEEVKRYAEFGITARLFSDAEEAMIWLESQL